MKKLLARIKNTKLITKVVFLIVVTVIFVVTLIFIDQFANNSELEDDDTAVSFSPTTQVFENSSSSTFSVFST